MKLAQCERVRHHLLHLGRRELFAKSRHFAHAVYDEVRAPKIVEVAFGEVVRSVEAALAVGPVAAHAVLLKEELAGRQRRLGRGLVRQQRQKQQKRG